MEEKLLSFNPTDVVIMFGMNDVGGTYGRQKLTNDKLIEHRFCLDGCLTSIKKLLHAC